MFGYKPLEKTRIPTERVAGERQNHRRPQKVAFCTLKTPAIPEPIFYSVRRDTQDPTRFTLTYFAKFATEYEVQSCGVSATIACNQSDPDNSTDWSPIQTTTATPGTQTTYSTTVLLAQQDTTYYFRIRAKHNTQVSVWERQQAQ